MRNEIELNEGRESGLRDLLAVLKDRGLAVIAFVLMGIVAIVSLNVFVPPDDEPNLGLFGRKVDHFVESHQDYNVLLIGTSRTYRGLDPALLQRVAARGGCDVRAFNLGIPKLRLTELRLLSDRLTPGMLKDYDLIVMSPMASSGIVMTNWSSNRIQHFSDWEGYWTSLVDIWHTPLTKGFPKRVYYSALLTGSFAYRQLGIGRLASNLRGTLSGDADNPSGYLFDGSAIIDFSRDGYVALDDEPSQQFAIRGQQIKDDPDYFETLKTREVAVDDFRGAMAERSWKRFEWAKDHLAAFDGPIALFLPPLLTFRAQDQALAEVATAEGAPVLNYNRSDLYPELFEREHWFDYYHVGESGAEMLTTMMGEDICSLIDSGRS